MSKPVRTNPFADDDIFSHVRYYAVRSAFLGERLWNEVQAAFKLISEFPLIGEVVPRARVRGTARRVLLRHFPFFVIYRNHEDYVESWLSLTQAVNHTTGVAGSIDR